MTVELSLRQASFPDLCPITAAVETLSGAGSPNQRGAVFTRPEVVEFILDLTGYVIDRPLWEIRLLEPCFGAGDFLLPAIDRLLAAWQTQVAEPVPEGLADCIRAVELHRETYDRTFAQVVARLAGAGIDPGAATWLAERWLLRGDYLLAALPGHFDVVVGNPPYVRTELIPAVLMAEYRARYTTIYDRADLYIPFIERSLRGLAPGGSLGFICADRWMKNRYGGPLRALVADHFHLRVHVDMTDTRAFHDDVIAYPAVTVITRDRPGPTRVARRPSIDRAVLAALAGDLTAACLPESQNAVRELVGVTSGGEPWILESSTQMALVRRLEGAFPLLEDTGCRVGIGVATGADGAFIGLLDELDVEADRKLPLVMTGDIATGAVRWRGFGVINPFRDDGGLVDLATYPRLRRYLEHHRAKIAARHCARKAPASWYRTIDRITPSLASKPKLLIPDIKGEAQVVYEPGGFYPHHNLYYVTADTWDLQALQAVLLSGIARLFVSTYSTRMRGGYLRFQAQYLRRIRLPRWDAVSPVLREELKRAALSHDVLACNRAAFRVYDLSPDECAALGGSGEHDAA